MQGDIENNTTWRLWYRMQTHAGVWSPPVQVGNVPVSEESRGGQFADGTRFVAFQGRPGGTPEFMYSEKAGATWTSPVFLTPNDGAGNHVGLPSVLPRVFANSALRVESVTRLIGPR